MFYYGYDPTYILVLIGFGITLLAQIFVSSSYKKYKKVETKSGLQGFEVARRILDMNGLHNVDIVETKGELTDHYDPTRKVVRLSTDIYHGKSIASSSVAAHECGHAVQDKEGYFFLRLRASLVPVVNISTKVGMIALMIGLIFGALKLAWLGIFLELGILLFQLITLPVEFDASKRAAEYLKKETLIEAKEQSGSKKMLNAAAMTYVASVVSALLEILRLVLLVSNSSRDD
ncbi:MAG: zinc metallopeptidase [Bacilli bacterium]|nr:zinc metallopeptidase [Bacilli bacterium]